MDFEAFPSIPRMRKMTGCIITEKVDGTNAQIMIDLDGTVTAGSRNRLITPDKDNFGFASWVQAHADEIRAMGLGRRFYGEWYGAGIQRTYGLTEKRFALFHGYGLDSIDGPGVPACMGVVPTLYTGEFGVSVARQTLTFLEYNGSSLVPGFMRPEGIVVRAFGHNMKMTLEGDGHKGLSAGV